MDPSATVSELLRCQDVDRCNELCAALAEWIERGGFKPDPKGLRYWPGTGTRYAILSPAYDTGERWLLVRYDLRGKRMREWALS